MTDLRSGGSAPLPRSTLGNVAALAGVSPKTASRALNDHPGVSAPTRQRVQEAARMLRFRPNALARELRTGAVSRGVGLVIADLANPFYSRLAAAAEQELRSAALELFLASTDEDPGREQEVVRTMLDRRVRALLVVPAAEDHSYLESEKSLGTPIVFLDRPPRNLAADAVLADNRAAARQAARSLLEAGHQRIAVIGDEQVAWTARERLAGAEAALAESGAGHGLVRAGAHDPAAARQITDRLLAEDRPPTAILALNNLILLGVLLALRDAGRDLTLIGFDDSEVADLFGVSVVSLDPREMGRVAARIALGQDDHGRRGDHDGTVVLPTRMVIRTPLDRPIRVSPR